MKLAALLLIGSIAACGRPADPDPGRATTLPRRVPRSIEARPRAPMPVAAVHRRYRSTWTGSGYQLRSVALDADRVVAYQGLFNLAPAVPEGYASDGFR